MSENSEQRDSWLNSGHWTLDADRKCKEETSFGCSEMRPQRDGRRQTKGDEEVL